MIGYGDNAGSGIPTILKTWENYGWQMPTLIEDTSLNQVTLNLMMNKKDLLENEKEKSAESAEKSAEKLDVKLSKRHLEIIEILKSGEEYSSDEIAAKLGIQSPRTRQLLNELHTKGLVEYTAETKNRRYKINIEG